MHAQVFICQASLCLLVGASNLFTFKVIIYMYDPITIFLIVFGLFCGESQGRGSLVGYRLWARTESDTTEVT